MSTRSQDEPPTEPPPPWRPAAELDADDGRAYHVTPRYLAGSSGNGDPGFAPVAHWPHHFPEDGPCQLLVTSPDGCIRIGWFGDDYHLWKITAAEDVVAAPRWTATFSRVTPPEIVAGLTSALAEDYAAGNDRFLFRPPPYRLDALYPLTHAGWTRGASEPGTTEITAPDRQAGVLIDNRAFGTTDAVWTLWAGPPGWGTRAEAVFTAQTPSHLITATAAAFADAAPVVRERRAIHHGVEQFVTLSPVEAEGWTSPQTPAPLDVRRAAVTQALRRAAYASDPQPSLRVQAARARAPMLPVVGGPAVTEPVKGRPRVPGPSGAKRR